MLIFFFLMDFNVVMPAVHVGWSSLPLCPLKGNPLPVPMCLRSHGDTCYLLLPFVPLVASSATALTYNFRHSSGLPSSFSLNVHNGGRTLST